jgi:hypothetical protein
VNEPLNERAFAAARAVQRIAVLAGVVAVVIAWKFGLRWYWIALCGLGGYFVVGLIGAALGVRNPPARRPGQIPVGLPELTDDEKRILFGKRQADDEKKDPPSK